MQVTAATDAILDECTVITPTRSIVSSRLCTRLRPIFQSAASPISENWNAPADTRCGRRNDSSRPVENRIRRNRSWKRIPFAIGVLLSSFVVPDSHCKASAVKQKQMLPNSPDKCNRFDSLFVIGFSILPALRDLRRAMFVVRCTRSDTPIHIRHYCLPASCGGLACKC